MNNIKNTANVALGTPLVLTLGSPLESLSTDGAPRVHMVNIPRRQCQVEVQVLTFLKTKVLVPF